MKKLDDLIRETQQDSPKPDWQSIDEKLFARIEREPRPVSTDDARDDTRQGRVVWIGASLTLAAAAALLLLVHPRAETTDAERSSGFNAGTVAFGDVSVHGAIAHPGTQLGRGDRIDVNSTSYFEAPSSAGGWAVRWTAQQGSVLSVENAASPLILSLEKGSAEAQVTPVPAGEAFAVDVTASSGSVVRVAVHGTHLRVARDGDKVTIDLTEGVVSIGAPPRRGSTFGMLVTAPAHVELDARDLGSLRVDHAPNTVRTADVVTPTPRPEAETAFVAPINRATLRTPETASETSSGSLLMRPQPQTTSQKLAAPSITTPVVETWLRSSDEVMTAIQACARDSVTPSATFSTMLTMKVGDDGLVQSARFNPPIMPDARDCAANVIYKRTKLGGGEATIAIEIKR